MTLPDIQDGCDGRGIELDQVGIAGLRVPTTFSDGSMTQAGIATFDVIVTLPADRRGTHMSRMVEIVHDQLQVVDPRTLGLVLKLAASKLDVECARITVSIAVATPVTSPTSGRESWQASDLALTASVEGDVFQLLTSVTSQVTSLCPCSKAISDYGAHNQRSDVTVSVGGVGDSPYPIAVRQIVDIIRSAGSCPVYPIVKRPDERAITMSAFDHPAFVEDMARDLSLQLRELAITHEVRIRNLESIHSHDAVAKLSWWSEL